MHIRFQELVEKLKARFVPAPRSSSPPPLPSPVDKPESDKLAKTVLPNAVRTITPGESGISEEPSGSRARMVAVGGTPKRPRDLPPAVALALEPRVERVLSLTLSDVIDQMPEGYLKPRESFDTTRRVLLKAADVEKGMASGRPRMTIATLYQQMPEIFMQSVPASDAALVDLPFEKVIEELSNLRVRHDQTEEQVAAQYQTPFLQVTLEESERFGTKMEPVQLTEFPRMRMGMPPATAEAIAAAEPEPAAQEKFTPSHIGPKIASRPAPREKLPARAPVAPVRKDEETQSISKPEAATPENQPAASIPFSLQPTSAEKIPSSFAVEQVPEKNLSNGTGEPVFPRVPASSGPPVPPPAPVAPTRIPFKLAPLSQPKSEPEPAPAPAPAPAFTSSKTPKVSIAAAPTQSPASSEAMVTLSLRPILESLPPMQVAGDVSSVPAETKISFPFALIAPQLASGKVVIQPKDFSSALPSAHRDLFLPDAVDVPVQLSLPDVLANLPGNALQMREDQEIVTQDEIFETPFSTKAAEDAKRFGSGGVQEAPAAVPAQQRIAEKASEKSTEASGPTRIAKAEPAKVKSAPVARSMPPETSVAVAKPRFDAREALAKASALAGVGSCSIIFADGLTIAGNIPDEMHIDGLSAVAPTLLKKLEKHMLETQLGALTCLTVHGEKSPVTFFASGNICLTVVHDGSELGQPTRRELATITQELSRTYAQPGTAHVDH